MAALDGAIPAIIGAANAAGGSHQVDRSLRFNTGDSAYLNRAPSSASADRTIWTLSFWIKICDFSLNKQVFTVYSDGSNDSVIRINGNNYLEIYNYRSGSYQTQYISNAQFRDPSAWYHFVVSANGSTSLNAWVNGEAVTWSTSSGPNGVAWLFNNTGNHQIGRYNTTANSNFYLAEVNWIDGQALAETDFGAYDDNNNWSPKEYSGTYGTNGFYLKFADDSSNSALGTDSSGNGNTWTVNNINAQANTNAVAGTFSGKDGISFNGTDAEVTLSQDTDVNPGSGVFTFECYAYSNNNSSELGIYDGSPGGVGSLVIRRVGAGTLMVERHNQAFDITGAQFSQNTWHHVAVTRDSSNNVRLFVDGTQSGSTSTNNTYNYSGQFRLGRTNNGFTQGYISNVRLIKGTALYTSNFTPPTGNLGNVSGTTLLMAQSTTSVTAATVKPSSLTISAPGDGSVIDSLIDTPTNYEAESGNNGGNYCTLSPLKNAQTLSDGNLDVVGGSSWQRSVGTLGMYSGKYYWEYEITASNEHLIGVGPVDMQLSGNLGAGDPPGSGYGTETGYVNGTGANGSWSNTGGSTTGDLIGIAFDADNGNMYVYKNGSALNGGIASHTGLVMPQVPVVSLNGSSRSAVLNFGQRPFKYPPGESGGPSSDYKSLCTQNLAEPTVADGSTAFNATLYTGNGSARNISTPYGPDFVWIKSRSATYDHGAFDVLRGANQRLNINSNGAEGTEANSVTAFNSDSFSLGSLAFYNNPSTTFVAWNWNAGTSTESNTDGSITSQVRANTTAGFSIVSFTGDGSGTDTIGHGLNATPSTIWLKDLDNANNWLIYTTEIDGSLDYLSFNLQSAKADSSYSVPTSSVFSYGTDAADYIAYCFAPVAGYSEFGTYAGNQSSDGPFIYTGFRPRFVMVKVYDQSDNWVMWDSSRGDINVNDLPLYPNLNNSETTNLGRMIDFLSNGFKLRSIDNSVNGTHNYLYWAFAEHPINTARAR